MLKFCHDSLKPKNLITKIFIFRQLKKKALKTQNYKISIFLSKTFDTCNDFSVMAAAGLKPIVAASATSSTPRLVKWAILGFVTSALGYWLLRQYR
jgi:hypothetical protein